MTFLALLILGALWAAVLLPPMIQRVQSLGSARPSRGSAVGGFSQNLARLDRAGSSPAARVPVGGRHGYAPHGLPNQQREALLPDSALAAARRRRDVVGSLIAIALFLLVAATMFGRIAVYAHIVVDVIAVGFFGLMFRRNRLAAQRAAVVTQLPSTPSTVQPVFAEDDMSFEDGLVGDSTVVDLSVARQYRKTS